MLRSLTLVMGLPRSIERMSAFWRGTDRDGLGPASTMLNDDHVGFGHFTVRSMARCFAISSGSLASSSVSADRALVFDFRSSSILA